MRHKAHVAHHSRGRLRIRIPAAKGNPAALEVIRASLAGVDGVKDVAVNETIGSLTVHYDPKHHVDFEKHVAIEKPPADVQLQINSGPNLEDLAEIDSLVVHEAEFLAQHSNFAKTILDFVNDLDITVKRATHNNLDFKVVAPLVVAAAVFMELGVTASTPVWLTLGLFSFNHFVDLHTHGKMQIPGNSGPSQPAPTRKHRSH